MTQSTIDYDLHGLVGIRLIDASARDCQSVERHLALPATALDREPDIVVRFVPALARSEPVYMFAGAAFTENRYFAVRTARGRNHRVHLPWENLGGRCVITCETAAPRVPLLIPIINLTMLAKGFLPLHASAFRYKGCGLLVAGWSSGGKTSTLLGFMLRGAQYIGDEWVYVSPGGAFMFGLPSPIHVRDWHLRSAPEYERRIPRIDLVRLRRLRRLRAILERIPSRLNSWAGQALLHRLSCKLERETCVEVRPEMLFGAGKGVSQSSIEHLILTMPHEESGIAAFSVPVEDVVSRILHSLQYEMGKLRSEYLKFRFAFPGLRNELIERSSELEGQLAASAFRNKKAHVVRHPHPVSLSRIVEAIEPLLSDRSTSCLPSGDSARWIDRMVPTAGLQYLA